jgi:DNA-binding Lrp family transcriptional regulator
MRAIFHHISCEALTARVSRRRRRATESFKITPVDVGIIRCLHRDARKSLVKIAKELGMPESTVRHRLNRLIRHGRLYRRTGKREQAQQHLTTATTMYREMDMRFWLEQAEAETRE